MGPVVPVAMQGTSHIECPAICQRLFAEPTYAMH